MCHKLLPMYILTDKTDSQYRRNISYILVSEKNRVCKWVDGKNAGRQFNLQAQLFIHNMYCSMQFSMVNKTFIHLQEH